MDVVPMLQRHPLFAGLTCEVLATLAGKMLHKQVRRNQHLFRAGEECIGLFLVVKGRIAIYHSTADGREQVIDTAGPGESLSEVPLFDGGPHPASARAVESAYVLCLSRADFHRVYQSRPELAAVAVRRLGARFRKLLKLVNTVSLKEVPARVATRLVEYAGAADRLRDGAIFILPCSHVQLAAELGTTRESVTRAFMKLRQEAIIEQQGVGVRILDLKRLYALAGRDPEGMQLAS
jgi:CRP/FNR family transcriptional regulator